MKILYLDLLSPMGHKGLNKIFVKLLRKFASIDVSWKEGYIEDISALDSIRNFYPIPEIYYNFSSKIEYRTKNYSKIKWIFRNIDISSYDLIFISSYETISFSLAWPRNIESRVLILNHNNLDELDNPFKRTFFKRIPKYIEHIVFEEYMKEYMIENIGVLNKVWVVHHPIDFDKIKDFQRLSNSRIPKFNFSDNILIFAPSTSNDENFISKLINLQREQRFLSSTRFKLLVKSKQSEYQDDFLIVVKKYFTYEEYLLYLNGAFLILLPYPKSFKYRISGVLFDCFAFQKRFISSSVPIFEYYINKYPEIGETFNSINNFQEILFRISKGLTNYSFTEVNFYANNSFAIIRNDYSNEQIEKELQAVIKERNENL